LRLVETGVDGASRSVDVMVIDRLGDLGDIADLGLTLAQGKQLAALVQQKIVTAQSRDHDGRCVAPAEPLARSRITAPTRSPPCSVRSRSGCPASAAPVAVGQRLGTAGQHIAARRPNSIRSGRSFPPVCLTGLPPACSNTFYRSMLGSTPRPCVSVLHGYTRLSQRKSSQNSMLL
jgi:hypothetical protein